MQEKQVSQEDLELIKNIRNQYNELTFRLGQLYIDKVLITKQAEELDNINTDLDNQLENLKNSENDLLKQLEEKYGVGTLNIETGTIITKE